MKKDCEYFPCHEVDDLDSFSCEFCFCPLYDEAECGGVFSFTPKGLKDCSKCVKLHVGGV
ncbi:MAG: cysteine-rich small domain-containing protein [Oscillospiraceae bacterium]|nr:cysteine-rich small domain-containing protein [Oscillospiraceae bacterium]